MTEPPAADAAILATLTAVARRLDAIGRIAPAADDALLSAIAGTATTVLDAQAASIAAHDPAGDRLVFVASAGPSSGQVVGLEIDAGAGIAGYAFATGQQLAVADVSADPRFDRSVAEATGYVPGSILATPLLDAEGAVGVLEVLDRRGGPFTLRDLDVARALAREATIVLRARRTTADGAALLRAALAAVAARAGTDDEGPVLREDDIDAIVSDATLGLATDPDDPIWRLADRIARLRHVDPDSVALVADWLDALLRRRGRSGEDGDG